MMKTLHAFEFPCHKVLHLTALASGAEGFEQFVAQQKPKKNGLSSQFMSNMLGDMFGGIKSKGRRKSKAPEQQFKMLNWL